jgi:hypothetical protein
VRIKTSIICQINAIVISTIFDLAGAYFGERADHGDGVCDCDLPDNAVGAASEFQQFLRLHYSATTILAG